MAAAASATSAAPSASIGGFAGAPRGTSAGHIAAPVVAGSATGCTSDAAAYERTAPPTGSSSSSSSPSQQASSACGAVRSEDRPRGSGSGRMRLVNAKLTVSRRSDAGLPSAKSEEKPHSKLSTMGDASGGGVCQPEGEAQEEVKEVQEKGNKIAETNEGEVPPAAAAAAAVGAAPQEACHAYVDKMGKLCPIMEQRGRVYVGQQPHWAMLLALNLDAPKWLRVQEGKKAMSRDKYSPMPHTGF